MCVAEEGAVHCSDVIAWIPSLFSSIDAFRNRRDPALVVPRHDSFGVEAPFVENSIEWKINCIEQKNKLVRS